MKTRILISLLASSLVLTACNPTKQDIGTVIGAGAGAAAGSQIGDGTGQIVAVALGTLIGGYIGGSIGKSMDDVDRMKMNRALETQPTGQAYSWQNPDTGYDYTVTPTETYQSDTGPCRDYTTEAVIDGNREVVHGTACRQSDGRWVAMN